MSTRILSDERKITAHREIARINRVIQFCLTQSKNVRRVSFKERFTINKIRTKASNIHKAKFQRVVQFKLSGLRAFDNMVIIH